MGNAAVLAYGWSRFDLNPHLLTSSNFQQNLQSFQFFFLFTLTHQSQSWGSLCHIIRPRGCGMLHFTIPAIEMAATPCAHTLLRVASDPMSLAVLSRGGAQGRYKEKPLLPISRLFVS